MNFIFIYLEILLLNKALKILQYFVTKDIIKSIMESNQSVLHLHLQWHIHIESVSMSHSSSWLHRQQSRTLSYYEKVTLHRTSEPQNILR